MGFSCVVLPSISFLKILADVVHVPWQTPRWHYWFDNWRRDEDRVKFEIIVTLPEGASKASPGYIKSFITELPNTSQELKDLSSLLFDSVVLTGTNSGITVGVREYIGLFVASSNGR